LRVVTPREMARIDQVAVDSEKIPGIELMERAGGEAARAARDMLSSSGGRKVAVWCGGGNNGGDGFVAARLLSGQTGKGLEVTVFMLASASRFSGDAMANLDRLNGLPLRVVKVSKDTPFGEFTGADPPFDLVIDAIFGTGFSGRPEGVFEEAIEAINGSGCPVLSVDIPSGVAGETGAVPGAAVRAERTVTFAAPKVGLVQFPGAALAGEIDVVDIGIPSRLMESVPESNVYLTTPGEAERLLPSRVRDAHKRQCGSVLVVAGSPGMTGAAALCASAALRSGAGLVTLAVPEGVHQVMEMKLTEVMTRPLPQTSEGTLSLKASVMIAELSGGFDVLALGPGLSTHEETVKVTRELVSDLLIPMVIDADGLNAMAGHTHLFAGREAPFVLTPHPGELARLLDKGVQEIQGDRIGTAREAAAKWGAVVVLKGAGTVIAEPAGAVRVNTTGNPGMATAGMGDVLTGCVASFVAQGASAFEAAVAGAYFHGHAADLAAQIDGEVGMLAGDVARHLPLAMRRP